MTRKTTLLLGIGIAVLAVGGLVLFRLPPSAFRLHRASVQEVYYCPMHPTYTSDRPGTCPICNMNLVKKEGMQKAEGGRRNEAKATKDICYLHNCPMARDGKPCPMLVMAKAGETVTCPICGTHVVEEATAGAPPAGYALVLMTPQKRQLIGVKTAPVVRRALTKTIRTVGRIAYDPELYQAEAEYLQALNGLLTAHTTSNVELVEQATTLVEAARMRLRLLGLDESLIEEMTRWSGPDERLLLTDLSGGAWVYATVYEFELPLVRMGQQVQVEVPAMPGRMLTGTVRSIDPVLDPTTRAARVRAVVTEEGGGLKPEMFVNASIVVELGEVLAVPEEAVINTGARQLVFVDQGEGLLEPRDVVLGAKAEGVYAVNSGVEEGETVVTNGNFLIDSESRLKAALEGMGAGGTHQHGS